MGKSSTETQTQKTNQNLDQWSSYQIPQNVQNAWARALGMAGSAANEPFVPQPGIPVAPFAPDTLQAYDQLRSVADPNNPLNQAASGNTLAMLSEAGRAPTAAEIQQYMNPYESNVSSIAAERLREEYDRQRQALAGQAALGGSYGGSRYGVQEAQLANDFARQNLELQYGSLQDSYNQALQQRNLGQDQRYNALGASENLRQQQVANAANLSNIGQAYQQNAQSALDFGTGEFQRGVQYPFETANFLGNMAYAYPWQASPQHTTSNQTGTTTATTTSTPSQFSQILGGISAVGGLFSPIPVPKFFKDGGGVKKYADGGAAQTYSYEDLISSFGTPSENKYGISPGGVAQDSPLGNIAYNSYINQLYGSSPYASTQYPEIYGASGFNALGGMSVYPFPPPAPPASDQRTRRPLSGRDRYAFRRRQRGGDRFPSRSSFFDRFGANLREYKQGGRVTGYSGYGNPLQGLADGGPAQTRDTNAPMWEQQSLYQRALTQGGPEGFERARRGDTVPIQLSSGEVIFVPPEAAQRYMESQRGLGSPDSLGLTRGYANGGQVQQGLADGGPALMNLGGGGMPGSGWGQPSDYGAASNQNYFNQQTPLQTFQPQGRVQQAPTQQGQYGQQSTQGALGVSANPLANFGGQTIQGPPQIIKTNPNRPFAGGNNFGWQGISNPMFNMAAPQDSSQNMGRGLGAFRDGGGVRGYQDGGSVVPASPLSFLTGREEPTKPRDALAQAAQSILGNGQERSDSEQSKWWDGIEAPILQAAAALVMPAVAGTVLTQSPQPQNPLAMAAGAPPPQVPPQAPPPVAPQMPPEMGQRLPNRGDPRAGLLVTDPMTMEPRVNPPANVMDVLRQQDERQFERERFRSMAEERSKPESFGKQSDARTEDAQRDIRNDELADGAEEQPPWYAAGSEFSPTQERSAQQDFSSATDTLARMDEIARLYGEGELFEVAPRVRMLFTGLRRRTFGENSITDQDREDLQRYAQVRQQAMGVMNDYIHEYAGSQVSGAEAQRMRAYLPNVGNGINPWSGDDPESFRAKVEGFRRDLMRIRIRSALRLAAGGTNTPYDFMPLDEAERTFNERAQQYYDEIRQEHPRMAEQNARREALNRLRRDLNLD